MSFTPPPYQALCYSPKALDVPVVGASSFLLLYGLETEPVRAWIVSIQAAFRPGPSIVVTYPPTLSNGKVLGVCRYQDRFVGLPESRKIFT